MGKRSEASSEDEIHVPEHLVGKREALFYLFERQAGTPVVKKDKAEPPAPVTRGEGQASTGVFEDEASQDRFDFKI